MIFVFGFSWGGVDGDGRGGGVGGILGLGFSYTTGRKRWDVRRVLGLAQLEEGRQEDDFCFRV